MIVYMLYVTLGNTLEYGNILKTKVGVSNE